MSVGFDSGGWSGTMRAEATTRPSAEMLGITAQSPPPCIWVVFSPTVTARLSGKRVTNNAAPGNRGKLSLFASTEEVNERRQYARTTYVANFSTQGFFIFGFPIVRMIVLFPAKCNG